VRALVLTVESVRMQRCVVGWSVPSIWRLQCKQSKKGAWALRMKA